MTDHPCLPSRSLPFPRDFSHDSLDHIHQILGREIHLRRRDVLLEFPQHVSCLLNLLTHALTLPQGCGVNCPQEIQLRADREQMVLQGVESPCKNFSAKERSGNETSSRNLWWFSGCETKGDHSSGTLRVCSGTEPSGCTLMHTQDLLSDFHREVPYFAYRSMTSVRKLRDKNGNRAR